jgi:predicted dehydrogenase
MTPDPSIGVAIVGCGLIGQKRAKSIRPARLAACADVCLERAQALAKTTPGATATSDWRDVLKRADVDVVIVATTNDALAEVSLAALDTGKQVLVEKPRRAPRELEAVIEASRRTATCGRVQPSLSPGAAQAQIA